MTEPRDVTGILRDISVLYELSLSVGQSIDLNENCDRFLRTLMARKSLAFTSVWVRDRFATGEEDSADGWTRVYANPSFGAPYRTMASNHPVLARLVDEDCFSVSWGQPGFEQVSTESGVDRGTFAVYRLGEIGILKLYSNSRSTPFSPVELRKLRHVVEKFTVSLKGCLDHQRVREAEQRRKDLELQMLHAQKLESMGLLAGGVAHDFNNLLTVVLGNAELIRPTVQADARTHVDNIVGAAVRAAELCSQLLAYSGGGRFVSGPVLLNEVVDEMLKLSGVTISKMTRVMRDLAPDLPAIVGDPTQIRQVVMNLVTNASEALGRKDGELRAATGVVQIDSADLSEFYLGELREPGEYVFLDIADTGCGIDGPSLPRLFDPFFTTKFTGRGLGLAAVLGIVRSHHGAIRVRSVVEEGTEVRVLFPKSTERVAGLPETHAPEALSGGGRILIVDDEESVRLLLGRLVSDLGFAVMFAADGGQAVDAYAEHKGNIELVILDLTMPVMGGDEAFERIMNLDPDARVVLTSGYSEVETHDRFHGSRPAAFLAKPFRAADVVRTIRCALPERTTTPP